jgi:hypothetical protein
MRATRPRNPRAGFGFIFEDEDDPPSPGIWRTGFGATRETRRIGKKSENIRTILLTPCSVLN